MRRSNPNRHTRDEQPARKSVKLAPARDEMLFDIICLAALPWQDTHELDDAAIRNFIENLDKERRVELILAVVATANAQMLLRLITPLASGGFAWSLDVQALDGRTPVSVAFQHNKAFATALVTPVENSGLGLMMDRAALKSFLDAYNYHPTHASNFKYRKKKLTRQQSFVERKHADGTKEIYSYVHPVGRGTNSLVRLFQSTTTAANKIIVKEFLNDDMQSGLLACDRIRNFDTEVRYMQHAYPGLQPLRAQHHFQPKLRKHHSFFIMPYICGFPMHVAISQLSEIGHLPNMFLAVAIELARIHASNIVHGDVKYYNILVDIVESQNGAVPIYQVKFIDFEYSKKIGEKTVEYANVVDYFAPEHFVKREGGLYAHPSQDVYSFGYMVLHTLSIFTNSIAKSSPELKKVFQCMEFYAEKFTNLNPGKRPALTPFINSLSTLLTPSAPLLKP